MSKVPENSQDIYYSIKFFFFALKIFGLAPFTMDLNTRRLKITFINIIEFIISCLFWLFLSYNQIKFYKVSRFYSGIQSGLLDGLCQFQNTFQQFAAILIIIFNFCKHHNVANLFAQIDKFDQTVKRLDWKFQVIHSRFLGLAIFFISTFAVLMHQFILVYSMIIHYNTISEMYAIYIFSFIVVTEFSFLVATQFILSTYYIYARLVGLHHNIR